MGKFIVKRLGQIVLVLFIVSILIFVMVRITPSDPIASITQGKNISDETRQELMVRYHLDKSNVEQYFIWITGVFQGKFGESYQYNQEVGNLISQRISVTLSLVLLSGILAILISIPIGVISAVKMNTWIDKLLSGASLVFVASPVFLTALVLMYIFSLKLGVFPSSGTGDDFFDSLYHMILPAIALAMSMIALTSRITRTTMIEQLNSDYIRTAIAKGIPYRKVVMGYALKNALIPIITVTSIQLGSMIVGAVLVESVFAMGGLGDLLISGIKSADYPVVQSVTLLMVGIFLAINFVVDILYGIIDPRIRMK